MQAIKTIVLLTCILDVYVSAVRIGSFNLQQYGSKKSGDTTITNYIATLLNDFDIGIIQEITDVTLQAPYVLYDALNKLSGSKPYTMALSERAGRTSSKEQYIFFNRESTSGVKLINSYLYNDYADHFERPP